jgi:hypothetical protein
VIRGVLPAAFAGMMGIIKDKIRPYEPHEDPALRICGSMDAICASVGTHSIFNGTATKSCQ